MLLLILSSAFAVPTRKTILPRRMFVFHMPTWQIIFALIPDIRKLAGAEVSTMDFVLSQDSGNAALLIWSSNPKTFTSVVTGEALSLFGGQMQISKVTLVAIAACVVGGVSFTGGIGKISGVVTGVCIFTALTYSLTILGIDTNLQFVFSGIIILVAVTLDCLKYVQKK